MLLGDTGLKIDGFDQATGREADAQNDEADQFNSRTRFALPQDEKLEVDEVFL